MQALLSGERRGPAGQGSATAPKAIGEGAEAARARPGVAGKFLAVGEEKLYVRGVTYGTFRPDADGCDYPAPATVERDFARMSASNINAIRTYTVPARWLLDAAHRHGLYVMVGMPWEQHVDFLERRNLPRSIESRVRAGVRACAGHPAVLCYAVGNEIPSSIVRWLGRRRVERFIERLYRAAKDEDPDGLVTYVNYPSTEYLQLPFLDLACFNVYLESEDDLEAYLARLQNIAGDSPLVMAEVGLDSRRTGEDVQALVLGWQVRTAFRAGCAGAFVFSWTDEWHRGGFDVDDWDFGLTDRARRPKAALASVAEAFAEVPFGANIDWPRISVCICSHNGARTLRECLAGVLALDYPDYEVILVDDGSTDGTAAIGAEAGVTVISTRQRGLSGARNAALHSATGEIVAYLDDDAHPDPHWLSYLAATLVTTRHAAVGGPNIASPGGRLVAECVDRAPGGPVHVLVTDREAEHIPGCNMAFRRDVLEEIGGFDERFWSAGDDVDLCWRLQNDHRTIGFNAAAMVWHRRRETVRGYLRQQRGYGEAEALLERKWPERYNSSGHLRWVGRVYQSGLRSIYARRWRIYYGTWGTGLFQSVYHPAPSVLAALPLMPEWYLVLALFAGIASYGFLVHPLLFMTPLLHVPFGTVLFAVCVIALALQSWRSAASAHADFHGRRLDRLRRIALTALLFLLQPLARLVGRLRRGLSPWRSRGGSGRFVLPWPRTRTAWYERWREPTDRLRDYEEALRGRGLAVRRGGAFDRWDIDVRLGPAGGARMRVAVEEHGYGRQLLRFRVWPTCTRLALVMAAVAAALLASAISNSGSGWWALAAAFATLVIPRIIRECGASVDVLLRTVPSEDRDLDLSEALDQRLQDVVERVGAEA